MKNELVIGSVVFSAPPHGAVWQLKTLAAACGRSVKTVRKKPGWAEKKKVKKSWTKKKPIKKL
jgi:hypothetical protein